MAGHGPAGKIARGYWTRLYARAFYFRDKDGHVLTLVSCDMFGIAAGLHDAVARELASRGVSIPPDRLIIAATHTHQGPGNYLTSAIYNGFSSAVWGFDQKIFDFLTCRIADAISEAHCDAESHAASRYELVLRTGMAAGIQRNRAVAPFQKNLKCDRTAYLGGRCQNLDDLECVRYNAVDPTVNLLEVRRSDSREPGSARRIALLVFFAVHPTAMSHESTLYGSDFVGRAMSLIERLPANDDDQLVAGFFNGAEGDIHSQWDRQNRNDVLLFGDRLAHSIRSVLSDPSTVADAPEESPEIRAATKQFHANPPDSETEGLAPKPIFGVAALGGADDGRTIFFQYGWHGGVVTANPMPGQGDKVPGLDLPGIKLLKELKISRLVEAPRDFPKYLPVSFAAIGNLLGIGAVPFEMTTMTGYRIRRSLKNATPYRAIALVGLANEYLSYIATCEEYQAQNYEGAMTIFGPGSADVVQRLLKTESEDAYHNKPPEGGTLKAVHYRVGIPPPGKLGPSFLGEKHATVDEGLDCLMPDSTGRADKTAPQFQWSEPEFMGWGARFRAVSIEAKDSSGNWRPLNTPDGLEDDTGSDLLTVLVEGPTSNNPGTITWAAIWVRPACVDPNAEYRFRVVTRDPTDTSNPAKNCQAANCQWTPPGPSRTIWSEPFKLSCPNPSEVLRPCEACTP